MSYATTGQPRLWISGAGAPTTSTLAAAGATYWDTTNSVAYQNIGTATAPIWVRIDGTTAPDYYKTLAAARLGVSGPTLRFSFDDLYGGTGTSSDRAMWSAYTSGGGTALVASGIAGGVLQTGTSASANDIGEWYQPTSTNYPCSIAGDTGGVWWFGKRFKITGTPGANTIQASTMREAGGTNAIAAFGAKGAVSTTNYVADCWGATGISTVAINTAWHTMEVWRVGGATWLSVDSETPVSIGVNGFPDGAGEYFIVSDSQNGAAGGAGTHSIDWYSWATVI